MCRNKMKRANLNGNIVGIGEVGAIKAAIDGVSVECFLIEDDNPMSLCMTFHWPDNIPERKIDFVIKSVDVDDDFIVAFRHGSFGPEVVYSENSNPQLIRSLSKTADVHIVEVAGKKRIEYQCRLMHCGNL